MGYNDDSVDGLKGSLSKLLEGDPSFGKYISINRFPLEVSVQALTCYW